jgi:hypothetical protein
MIAFPGVIPGIKPDEDDALLNKKKSDEFALRIKYT